MASLEWKKYIFKNTLLKDLNGSFELGHHLPRHYDDIKSEPPSRSSLSMLNTSTDSESGSSMQQQSDVQQIEEEIPSPNHMIPRGPSPEPKIEDTECHRSQSAMFVFLFQFSIVFCKPGDCT